MTDKMLAEFNLILEKLSEEKSLTNKESIFFLNCANIEIDEINGYLKILNRGFTIVLLSGRFIDMINKSIQNQIDYTVALRDINTIKIFKHLLKTYQQYILKSYNHIDDEIIYRVYRIRLFIGKYFEAIKESFGKNDDTGIIKSEIVSENLKEEFENIELLLTKK